MVPYRNRTLLCQMMIYGHSKTLSLEDASQIPSRIEAVALRITFLRTRVGIFGCHVGIR